jgi:hypothetical protein
MGFPEDATRTAIQLCEGSVEIAAELLISGDVSIEGLRAIVPPVADGLPATTSDIPGLLPLVVENGGMLTLLSQGSASVTRSDGLQFFVSFDVVDEHILEITGLTLMQFLNTAAVLTAMERRSGPEMEERRQQCEDLTVRERWDLRQLSSEIGTLAEQCYILAGKDLEQARLIGEALIG